MNTPKVSVIVPVYNCAPFLKQCADSIINQTLRQIEIIFIDAGSDDNSVEILNGYVSKDNRITVVSGKGRLDAGAARNIGLAMAKGEYLSFLDADDFFNRKMLEETYLKAVKEDADVVVFAANMFNQKTGKTSPMPWSLRIDYCPKKLTFAPQDMERHLFNAFQNWTWNKLFRREFISANNIVFQEIARTNDMLFTCHALAAAQTIAVIDKTYVTYRTGNSASLQSTNDKSPLSFWQAYKETKRVLENNNLYEKFKASYINTVVSGVLYNLENIKTKEAFDIAVETVRKESEAEFDILSMEDGWCNNDEKYKSYLDMLDGKMEFCSVKPQQSFKSRCRDKILNTGIPHKIIRIINVIRG